jgi:rhamnulokinase
LRYHWVLERLQELTGKRLDTIHIVGGGSQNTLLCQLTADCCNRRVVAGPVEATAIGNVLTQALGLRLVGSLADGREIVRRSFEVREYLPKNPELWPAPIQRFASLLSK